MQIEHDVTKTTQIRPSVSAVILNERRELLLQRRSDNGQWEIPGGSVEIGESVMGATVREVREETGLLVEVVRLVGFYSDPKRQVVRYPDGVWYTSSTPVLSVGLWAGSYRPVRKRWSWPTSSPWPCHTCWSLCIRSASPTPCAVRPQQPSGSVAPPSPLFMEVL